VQTDDRIGHVELGRTTGRKQKEGQIFLGRSSIESHKNLNLMKDNQKTLDQYGGEFQTPQQRRVIELRAADK